MAEDTKAPEKTAIETPQPVPNADRKRAESDRSSRYAEIIMALSSRGLAVTLAISLIANGVALATLCSSSESSARQLTPEVSLGRFGFVSSQAEVHQVVKAEFSVHVALADNLEEEGRRRISQRQFRLQQDLEELLRGAHSGDFDDPLLRDLKQKIKERIDKTLGIRAAAYVIITGLKTERNDISTVQNQEPGGLVPWVEPTAD